MLDLKKSLTEVPIVTTGREPKGQDLGTKGNPIEDSEKPFLTLGAKPMMML